MRKVDNEIKFIDQRYQLGIFNKKGNKLKSVNEVLNILANRWDKMENIHKEKISEFTVGKKDKGKFDTYMDSLNVIKEGEPNR